MIDLKLSCVPMIYFQKMVIDKTMNQEDWIKIAVSLDLQAIEIQHKCLESYEPRYINHLVEVLKKYKLKVCQITGSGDFVNPNPNIRSSEIDLLKKQISVAKTFGALSVRITAGQQHPELPLETALKNFRECMEQCFPLAEQAKVYLAYENHYKDYFWQYPDYSLKSEIFLRFFEYMLDTPLRVNFDCANQIMSGEDPLVVLEQVKNRVVHMHANDRKVKGQYPHSIIGEGVTPLKQIFKILIHSGFDGWVSIEYNGTEGLDGLKKSIFAVKQIWKDAQS